MSKAHQRSILPLQDMTQVVDDNTVELFHYDISPNGVKGTKLADDIYDDSLVCWLEMQERNTPGTYVVDKSRYGRHGYCSNVAIANGRKGKAMSFNGDDSYVELVTPLDIFSSSFTMEMWVYFNDDTRAILIGDYTRPNAINVNLERTTSNALRLYWASSPDINTNASAVVTGQWQHCVCVRDKDTSQVLFYVNGALVYTYSGALTDKTTSGLHLIGRDNRTGTTTLNGLVDSVRIYSRALSATEILARYNESVYSIRPDGKYGGTIAIEEGTTNLWNGLTTNNSSGPWSIVDNPYPMVGLNSKVTMCTPRSYMNYYTWNDNAEPSGITYSVSAYVYVEPSCDSMGPIRLCGESETNFSVSYDMTKKGTWQYLKGTVTSNAVGYYFLLCANSGTGANTWTKGNVYYANVQVEKKSSSTSFVDGARTNGALKYVNPLPGAGNFTVSFWINLLNAPAGSTQEPILTLNNGSDVNGLYSDILSGTDLRFFTYNSAGVAQVATTTGWVRNSWMHIAIVRDNSKLYGYVNGVKKCETANSGTVALDGVLMFGTRNNSAIGKTNMLIDELRIDKTARTADEILSWYLSSCPFYPKGNERVVI